MAFFTEAKICSVKKEPFQLLPMPPITGKAEKGLKCQQRLCKVKGIPETSCGDQ